MKEDVTRVLRDQIDLALDLFQENPSDELGQQLKELVDQLVKSTK